MQILIAVAAAVLAVGIAGSYLVSARLRKQTRGVAPDELRGCSITTRRSCAVREGLVLLDREGRVVLCNDAARVADTGLAQRRPHYGQVGRPEVRFIWHRVQL